LADQGKAQNTAGAELRIEFWRLRTYSFGFVAAFVLHLALDGIERPPVLLAVTVVTLSIGIWLAQGPWLRTGVMLGVVHALIFPIIQQAMANNESIVAVVARAPIWPQLLVTLIGSRVLVTEGELSFAQFWRRPTKRKPAIEIHSIPSAIALGSFLTLALSLRSLCAVAFDEADAGNHCVCGAWRDHCAQCNHFPFFCNPVVNSACIAALPGGSINPRRFWSPG
jgi:hypothetical protein